MSSSEGITLYLAKHCAFCHRVEIVAEELGLQISRNFIDLTNKPQWYAQQVNAQDKVPALAYGGYITPGTNDSPQPPPAGSIILTESSLICEFLSDIASNTTPTSNNILPPSNPLVRYNIRAFVDSMSSSLIPAFMGFLRMGKPADGVYAGIEKLQDNIVASGGSEESGFATGSDITLADAVVAPFLARMEVTFSNDVGTYPEGEGLKLWEVLTTDVKYSVFQGYWERIKATESFRNTFDRDSVTKTFSEKYKGRKAA